MRTDSVKLSTQAVTAARALVRERYGAEYLPPAPRAWEGNSRYALEAHEAIRPAGETFRTPEEVEAEVGGADARLYDLIWKRTVASQMLDARHKSMAATFDCTLAGAANDGSAACGNSSGNPDIWYRFTAPYLGKLVVSTCGTHDRFGIDTGPDTVLSIHDAAGNQIDTAACNDDSIVYASPLRP
jgi:DNA topoisomerase-1